MRRAFLELQGRLADALGELEGTALPLETVPDDRGGEARARLLDDGDLLERAAVMFSHAARRPVPPVLAERKPALAGGSYDAVSVSSVVHPRNPHAPTGHLNLRFFVAQQPQGESEWWFGGGVDLTPHYGYRSDAVLWHGAARAACARFGAELYDRFKRACDDYYFIPHRSEWRGIGGLFFDRLGLESFDSSLEFALSVGSMFCATYPSIVERRSGIAYGERERLFQLYRRGRYVEFNLVCDRGTRFGLEAGVRIEAVLASMPPRASWRSVSPAAPGSVEARLEEDFLRPRDWLAATPAP